MENLYIVFQCPRCRRSMEIRSPEALSCKKHGDIPLVNAIINITNEKGKMQLEETDVKIYLLVEGFSPKFLAALDSLRKSLEE